MKSRRSISGFSLLVLQVNPCESRGTYKTAVLTLIEQIREVLKVLKRLVAVGLVWFSCHLLFVSIDGLTDEEKPAEIAVVFGTKVHEDGRPSERLIARLDRSVSLYRESLVPMIFVSGGLGKEGHLEGSKMAEYLQSQGIPEHAIIVDNEGNTTGLTAQNLSSQFPELQSAVVVTQYFHISRSKLALRKVGIPEVSGAHADYFEVRDAYSLFREFFGYYKYLVLF